MEKVSENIVRKLIELNMERMYRFQNARELLKTGEASQLLVGLAAQSEGFIMELEYVLRLYEGSVGQAASQTLKDIDFNGIKDNDPSVLLLLFRCEQDALQVYDELLEKGNALDNDLFEKIRSQRTEIQDSKLRLEKMIQT
ncbi:hypothetical protein [Arachidicoccus terrestris]|uniref:hypothetical protein n=1 Tax=Arachidicoccus terrestris TaxID=2875539 RepID=UPI001CC5679E|nr:hypothetical protein [Arachidicoccus terrestris]UAY55921.1 hypothetical protein K9M52_02490 [Arachidicoccus terrestris]